MKSLREELLSCSVQRAAPERIPAGAFVNYGYDVRSSNPCALLKWLHSTTACDQSCRGPSGPRASTVDEQPPSSSARLGRRRLVLHAVGVPRAQSSEPVRFAFDARLTTLGSLRLRDRDGDRVDFESTNESSR